MNYLEKNDNGMTYYEFGSGDTLCILLSGWGTPYALADMYHLSTQMASDFRVIVIDRRGYSGFNEHITERSFNNVCMEIADIIEREADGKKSRYHWAFIGRGLWFIFSSTLYPSH